MWVSIERYNRIVSSEQQLSSMAANANSRPLLGLISNGVTVLSGITIVLYLVSACIYNSVSQPQLLQHLANLLCIILELFLLIFLNYLDFSMAIYVIKSVDQLNSPAGQIQHQNALKQRRIEFKKLFRKTVLLIFLTLFIEILVVCINTGANYYDSFWDPTTVIWKPLGCYR